MSRTPSSQHLHSLNQIEFSPVKQKQINKSTAEQNDQDNQNQEIQASPQSPSCSIRSNRLKYKKTLNGSIRPRRQSQVFSIEQTFGFSQKIQHSKIYTPNQSYNRQRKTSSPLKVQSQFQIYQNEWYSCTSQKNENSSEKTFDNLYVQHEKLGQGVHSIVYRCTEISTDKQFAVKKLKKQGEEHILRLKRIFRLLKFLSHPNIIKVKEIFSDTEAETVEVVMEYCQFQDIRENLNQKLQFNQKFKRKELQQIAFQMADVTNYLHSQGVCHRDIKPENILYCPTTMQIKLIDFDICGTKTALQGQFSFWTNTGTMAYRAPETFNVGYDQKSDIWSLGVTLYQLIEQKKPFKSVYEKDLIKNIQTSDVALTEGYQSINALILQCLSKPSKDRPSALKIKNFLERVYFDQSSLNNKVQALSQQRHKEQADISSVKAGCIFKGVFNET